MRLSTMIWMVTLFVAAVWVGYQYSNIQKCGINVPTVEHVMEIALEGCDD